MSTPRRALLVTELVNEKKDGVMNVVRTIPKMSNGSSLDQLSASYDLYWHCYISPDKDGERGLVKS